MENLISIQTDPTKVELQTALVAQNLEVEDLKKTGLIGQTPEYWGAVAKLIKIKNKLDLRVIIETRESKL